MPLRSVSAGARVADGPTCLTAGELETVKIVFGDVKTKKGEVIWTGYPAGTELQVASLRSVPTGPGGVWDVIRILGHQDKDYDWHNFDLDTEVAQADKRDRRPHLRSFGFQGPRRKTIAVPRLGRFHDSARPHSAVLQRRAGEDGQEAGRLVQSCTWGAGYGTLRGGGPGPDQFNKMGVTERWREAGQCPESIIASHVTGSRCGYDAPAPALIRRWPLHVGAGSTNDAASFSCKLQ